MRNEVQEKLSKIWWLFLLRGILMLFFGLLFVTAPSLTLAALILFVGAYWFIHGIFSIIGIFVGASGTHWGWLLLDGVIGILAGLFVLNHPLLSGVLLPTTVVIFLGIQGIIMGIVNLFQCFRGDGARALIVGVINILFGIILLGRPLVAVSVIPIVIGVFGIAGGILLIALSFHIRGTVKELAVR
jgi:uncharacterized membrane protein HdeD (DUF308 family)